MITQIEEVQASITKDLSQPLAELEEKLILYHEVPLLIQEKQQELDKKLKSSEKLEEDQKNNEELKEEIDRLNEEVSELEGIKSREDYINHQKRDIHVLVIYTNKNNDADINKPLRKGVDEVILELSRQKIVVRSNGEGKDKVYVLFDTCGGQGEEAVGIYDILNNVFVEPSVIIADAAWSAGTIFSLCCHSILMLENSLLGAIDTQFSELYSGNCYSAFSYIEGAHKYFDRLVTRIAEAENQESRLAIERNIESLLSPISIGFYGRCHDRLDQIANAIAYRHIVHRATLNDYATARMGIWDNFVQMGKFLGHGHGLNLQFLKDLKINYYNQETKSIERISDMFLEDYIYPIRYEDEELYDLVSCLHKKVLDAFDYLSQEGLPDRSLIAHRATCKIIRE